MAIPFAHHIDMQGLQLLNFVVHPTGTSPSSPSGGMMWWENDTWRLNVYDDSDLAWKRLVMGPSGATTIGELVTWGVNDGSELSATSYGIATDLNTSAPATSVARADAAKIYSDTYIANEAVGFTTPGAGEDTYSIQWQNSTSEWVLGAIGVGGHNVLSASHDATTHTAIQGDIIYSDVAANWNALAAGTVNQYLRMGATVPGWGTLDIAHDTAPTLGGSLDAADYSITNVNSFTFLDGAGEIRTGTVATNSIRFQAYDTDIPGYITFATLTAGLVPTFDLSTSTTMGSSNIAYEGGAFHDTFSDYVTNEHLDLSTITLTFNETANETTVSNTGVPYDLTTSRSWTIGLPDNVTIAGNLTTSALYTTNFNVTNINAYDGTAAITIADVTGGVTILNDFVFAGDLFLDTNSNVAHDPRYIYWGDAGDWDTYIGEDADDVFSIYVAGVEELRLSSTALLVDNITELTTDAGVTIEGVLIENGFMSLDYISPPAGDWSMNLANKQLKFIWVAPTSPDGALELEVSGAFTGDVLHIHQHTGNPGAGTHLIHLEAEDADVTPLYVEGTGTYSAEFANPIIVTDATTGQSTIGYGLIVNYNQSSLAIADFLVRGGTYEAITVDASADSMLLMSNPLGLVGFFGETPTVQSTGWAVTNHISDKILDANVTTINEICDVLGEIITELKLKGILGG